MPPSPNGSFSPSSPSSPSASGSSSRSARLRAQGNVFYKQVLDGGFSLTLRRVKLARALELYKQALNASWTLEDKASAYKNLGMLLFLFCKVELNRLPAQTIDLQTCDSVQNLAVCKSYIFDAVAALSKALEHGKNVKTLPWLDHLHNAFRGIVQWASEQTPSLSMSHCPLLQYVSQAFEDSKLPMSLKLLSFKAYAESLFHGALTNSLHGDDINYKDCHRLLEFCLVALRKAVSPSLANGINDDDESGSLLRDIEELHHSVYVHVCICESMHAVAVGDACLAEAAVDRELSMEKAIDSLDWYRQAAQLIRERDMETEAIAMSRIGKVYSSLLCMPEASHKFFFQAVRLALTVMSPSIERAEWYQFSLKKVQEHQEEVVARENEQKSKDRASIRKRLQGQLELLSKEAGKGAEALLKHVYEQHPHPDITKNIVPQVGTKSETKASLKKAILHYHPDTNMRHGDDWKVLCEEICKHLNDKYACFKGV